MTPDPILTTTRNGWPAKSRLSDLTELDLATIECQDPEVRDSVLDVVCTDPDWAFNFPTQSWLHVSRWP